MEGKKIYLQPMGTVIDAINDLIEMQKGRITYSDTPNGVVNFAVKMYAFKWELRFTVQDIGKNRCHVLLEIVGEERGREKFVRREFALLDTFLITGAEVELSEK